MRCEIEAAADTTTAEAAIAEAGTTDGMIVRTLAKTAREVCATLGEKTDAIEATRAASRTLKTAAAAAAGTAAAGTAAAAIAATVATAAAIAGAAIVIAATVATAVVIARVACASTGKRGAATAVSLVDSPTKANNAPRRFTANHAFALFFTVDRFDDDYDEPRIKIYDDVYICCC
jgi:plasmid stabilization system protein ParE